MLRNVTANTAEKLLSQRRNGATKRHEHYVAPLRRCVSMLLVLFLVLSCAVMTFAQQRSTQQSDANAMFRSARDLITDGEWARAQEKFSEYVNAYPNEKNLDAALYWLAYTQQKLGRYDQCRTTIERLLEKYPTTTWKEDARMLMVQLPGSLAVVNRDLVATARGQALLKRELDAANVYVDSNQLTPMAASGQAVTIGEGRGIGIGAGAGNGVAWTLETSTDDDDDNNNDPCEFKIVVLQALFQTDLQRGILAATDWLKPGSTQTVRCKGAALTLLGRNGGKAVTPVILGVARNEADLKLRARAISTLGATNDDSVLDALRDFALNSQENDIVEASLYALSKHTGERAIAVLSDIAVSGKTPGQRKLAIMSISTRPGEPAVDALFRIYDADQSPEIRRAVIYGFANRRSERAGNKLLEIARGSENLELRKAAINAISRRGGDKAVEFLLSLYDAEKNDDLKDQILNSLGYGTAFYVTTPPAEPGRTVIGYPAYAGANRMNDQRVITKLIEIARNPKEPMERRKRAIGWLSRSKDPKVLEFLQELLKQ
jgi:tetratricopeptide (TPR) repeat protein